MEIAARKLDGCSSVVESVGENMDTKVEAKLSTFDEPIHLLRASPDHRALVIDPSAQRQLESLGQITVLCVVGNQRGGKSTLMNLLHSRRLHGFQTGHYMDAQTSGVWIWPKPHPRRSDVTMVFVDTEGLDSPHVTQHYNWLISAVTLLMSDVYMYQTKGSIESSSAERLDMILKVAEQLGRSGGDIATAKGDRDAAGMSRKAFLWLLRDHQLKMKNSPKEELMEKLDPGQTQTLQSSFAEYDCVPLPRPGDDELLKRMDDAKYQDLSREFCEEFVVFERRILDLLLTPREILGGGLSGKKLADLLQHYLSAIEEQKGMLGEIAKMPTQRELLRHLAGRRAVDAGVFRYEAHLQEMQIRGSDARLPVPPAELVGVHSAARLAALDALQVDGRESGLDESDLENVRKLLDEKLAVWRTRYVLAGNAALGSQSDSPKVEGGSYSTAVCTDGSVFCKRPERSVPGVAQVSELSGGLFYDVWQANSLMSKAAYESLLQRATTIRGEAGVENYDPQTDPRHVVSSLYDSVRALLGEARGDDGLGPWGTAMNYGCGNEGGYASSVLLVDIAQQGDEAVVQLLTQGMQHQVHAMKAEMEEHKIECMAKSEGCARELQSVLLETQNSFMTNIEKIEETLKKNDSEFNHKLKESEACACDRAVDIAKKQLTEGLSNLQNAVRRALQEVETNVNSFSSEHKASLAAQERRVAEADGRMTEMVRDVESRAREAYRDLRAELESAEARSRDSVADLRRQLEATELRCTSALRTSEASLKSGEEQLRAEFVEQRVGVQHCENTLRDLREHTAAFKLRLQESECAASTTNARFEASLQQMQSSIIAFEFKLAEDAAQRGLNGLDARVEKACVESAAAHMAVVSESEHMKAMLGEMSEKEQLSQQQLEIRCKRALEEGSRHSLELVRKGMEAMEQSLHSIGADLAKVKLQSDLNADHNRQMTEALQKNDQNAIWESFAHLAGQLAQLQASVDLSIGKKSSKERAKDRK